MTQSAITSMCARPLSAVILLSLALFSLGQFLPDNDVADPLAPTYSGERCGWYDVTRLSWLSVRALGRRQDDRVVRSIRSVPDTGGRR